MPPHIEFGGIGIPELLLVAVGFVVLWGVRRLASK
jgi:Sec-independent protein translocase protein TatA